MFLVMSVRPGKKWCNLTSAVYREYDVTPRSRGVRSRVIWQSGDWRLSVRTSDIPMSATSHPARATVSVCIVAAEVGNAVGSGFPTPPHAATWCRVSMYVVPVRIFSTCIPIA